MPSHNQETEGLLSPFLRDRRLRRVGRSIAPHSVVLDLACGAGYLREFLPEDCQYFGVDLIPAAQRDRFTGFLVLDLRDPGAFETLRAWLPKKPDHITSIAFLEHLEDPLAFVVACRDLTGGTGRLVGTTPHPAGRAVHECLARVGLCSRQGAEEHERFLGRQDLVGIAADAGGALVGYQRFLGGLNQFFIIEFAGAA